MNRGQALKLLPESYARALTLRDGGASAADIAEELDIVVEAVPSLLRIATAKLDRLLADIPASGSDLEGERSGRHAVVAPRLGQDP
jgi:DNA-directed RNA polymerase specialized sigma24 family protein